MSLSNRSLRKAPPYPMPFLAGDESEVLGIGIRGRIRVRVRVGVRVRITDRVGV